MAGFFPVQRGWMDDPDFAGEPFSRAQAWLWLLEHAAFKPITVRVNGRVIALKRGQLCASTRTLASAWGWSQARVRRSLTLFQKSQKIGSASDSPATLITIRNYDEIQGVPHTSDAASGSAESQVGRDSGSPKEQGSETSKTPPLSPPSEGGRLRKIRRGRGADPMAEAPGPTPAELEEARRRIAERAAEAERKRAQERRRDEEIRAERAATRAFWAGLPGAMDAEFKWISWLEGWGSGGDWPVALAGPAPGDPDCLAPPEMAAYAARQRDASQPRPVAVEAVAVEPSALGGPGAIGSVSWDELAKLATVRKAKRPRPPRPEQREIPLVIPGGKAATGPPAAGVEIAETEGRVA